MLDRMKKPAKPTARRRILEGGAPQPQRNPAHERDAQPPRPVDEAHASIRGRRQRRDARREPPRDHAVSSSSQAPPSSPWPSSERPCMRARAFSEATIRPERQRRRLPLGKPPHGRRAISLLRERREHRADRHRRIGHQGAIDWNLVANDDIDFAFLRLGNRGATSGALRADEHVVDNLDGAASAGIDVGAYFFLPSDQ